MSMFIKTCLYLSIFSALLIPLLHTDALYFPAVTSKAIYFYAVVQISLILYIIHIIIEKKPLWAHWSLVSAAVFLFVGIISVASFFSENLQRSLFGDFERMDGFVTLFHLAIFFWLIISLFISEKIWHRFLLFSLGVSVAVFLSALVKFLEIIGTNAVETRVDVLLGNATFLGAYAMIHVFIAGYLAVKQKTWSRVQLILIGIAVLNVATIVFSGTRAALLGLLGGITVAIFTYLLHTKHIRFVHKLVVGFGICVVLISSIGMIYTYRAHLEDVPMVGRLLHLTPETITTQPRYFIWKAATQGFLEKPVIGWGPDNFLSVYSRYYSPETKSRFNVAIGETWIDRAHNMYFEWLVAGGVFGFASYLLLFGSLFYVAFTRFSFRKIESSILVGFIAAYMINNLFAFDSLSSYLLFFSFVGYLHFRAKPINFKLTLPYITLPVKKVGGIILIICVLWLGSITTVRGYVTAHSVAEFLKADDGSKKQHEFFKELIKDDVYAPWHVNAVLAEEVRVILKTKAGEQSVAKQFVIHSKEQINNEITFRNSDARALFLYCRAMREIGDVQSARRLCEKAVEQAPLTQEVLIELGQIYRELVMYEDSLAVLRKAFEGEPEYDLVRPEYAAALIYVGDTERANEILMERYGTLLVDDKSLLTAYIHIEAFADALQIIEKHIKKKPREIGYHISRISIYLKLKEKKQAIAAVEDMMRVDDSLQQTGEKIIEQIESDEAVLGNKFLLE